MKSTMIKVLASVLAIMMCAAAFVACGKTDDPAATTTAATTTAATTTEATTTAATTTADPNATTAPTVDDIVDDEEGCGSTVIGGLAVIMIVSGAALTLFKKKED